MEWVPLITIEDFAGIQSDLITATAGMLSLVFIVVGIGIIINVFLNR